MSYNGYHKLNVLVVDDFESFRQTIGTILRNIGVEQIDMANNGEMALDCCEGKKFDIVIADYNLGRGRNGQQLLEELRFRKTLTRETLFVLISSESSRSIIMSAYDYEPDAYLAKPINGKALKQRLGRLLLQRDQMLPIYRAIEQKDYSDAIELLNQRIISGARNTTLCQKVLAELYFECSDFHRAENVYRQALEVRSIDWAKVGMAKVKKYNGEFDLAKRRLIDIIRKNPLCLPAYDLLAEIYQDENNQEALEAVLMKVVEYCPMAILRQERLANVAQSLCDYQTAALAFRQTVRLGENSCHNKRENHLNFGRSTADLLKEDGSNAADISREAIQTLEKIGSIFPETEEEAIQALLITTQVLTGQGNHARAKSVIVRAKTRIHKLRTVNELDTELELVRALKSTGETAEAQELLERLVAQYSKDQGIIEKIDVLLDEPMSDRNRVKVSSINKEGISHYEQGNFRDSIEFFQTARKKFPNHIGIQLNLVQALEGEMEQSGYNRDYMKVADKTLSTVKNNISSTHDQYDRYLQLSELLSELKNKIN